MLRDAAATRRSRCSQCGPWPSASPPAPRGGRRWSKTASTEPRDRMAAHGATARRDRQERFRFRSLVPMALGKRRRRARQLTSRRRCHSDPRPLIRSLSRRSSSVLARRCWVRVVGTAWSACFWASALPAAPRSWRNRRRPGRHRRSRRQPGRSMSGVRGFRPSRSDGLPHLAPSEHGSASGPANLRLNVDSGVPWGREDARRQRRTRSSPTSLPPS